MSIGGVHNRWRNRCVERMSAPRSAKPSANQSDRVIGLVVSRHGLPLSAKL